MPACLAKPCQQTEHGADRARRDRGTAGIAAAQQPGHDPGGLVAGAVGEDAAGGGDLKASGTLPYQEGGDEAGMRRLAGGELEHQALAFLG